MPYRFDMVLQCLGDRLGVLGALFRDDGQIADLIAIVLGQISQRV